jgi:hypothetical protein
VRLLSVAVLIPLFLAPARPARSAEQAGVSAAVRGQVALTRVAIVGRQVVSGEPILLQDAIRSGTRSGMQILLLDQTVFTIGPESELVIDEFVYDPKTNAGKLSAEITKGVFRFVSGKIAHEKPEDMNVKLPAGTLGVRGTMVAGRVDDVRKSSRLVLLGEGAENDLNAPAGAFIACNAGVCVRVNRPGYGTVIDGPDAPPVQPFLFSHEEVNALTSAVSDPGGWLETARAAGAAPSVAAGPPGSEAGSGGDSRSPTEISGIGTAGGSRNSEIALTRLRTLDVLDQATMDASQFSTQSVDVNGQTVQIPTNCTDVSSCLGPTGSPGSVSSDVTTFDQLSTLAASGLQQAVYQRSGLPLVNTNGQADGSYDFSLQISLGNRTANLSFSNVSSSLLGLSGASVGQTTDYSQYPVGYNLPTAFAATGTVTGARGGLCAGGCNAVGTAELVNGNGRIADAALQALVVTAPTAPNAPPIGTVSASAQAIPRP